MSNFLDFRARFREHERIRKLIDLVPKDGKSVLDAGARDGSLSIVLTDYFETVTALDQKKPDVQHAKVISVEGDITSLEFPDDSFDCVMCAEVLEHIPGRLLEKACAELQRVTRKHLLIGVPYQQDIRVARTTCYTCGKKNPPWGHVNAFDEHRLKRLFPELGVETIQNVGRTTAATNAVSTFLMDVAGNPFGTYMQAESCIHCGARLKQPPPRNLFQKGCTRLAFWLNEAQAPFVSSRPNWIHILFRKPASSSRTRHRRPPPAVHNPPGAGGISTSTRV